MTWRKLIFVATKVELDGEKQREKSNTPPSSPSAQVHCCSFIRYFALSSLVQRDGVWCHSRTAPLCLSFPPHALPCSSLGPSHELWFFMIMLLSGSSSICNDGSLLLHDSLHKPWEISLLAPAAPLPPPSLTQCPHGSFFNFPPSLPSVSDVQCFCYFINRLSQRCHHPDRRAQLCPVMGPLEWAGASCVRHRGSPGFLTGATTAGPCCQRLGMDTQYKDWACVTNIENPNSWSLSALLPCIVPL